MSDEAAEMRRRAIAILAIAIGVALLLGVPIVNNSINVNKDQMRAATLALSPHTPIFIDGNTGFLGANGVVSGSGTVSDPYVIDGWDIDASAATGIEIADTDAYFIISDCYVHDGVSDYSDGGIYLLDCTNGVLTNNNCSNNWDGIVLDGSNGNTVIGNDCNSSIYEGIWLFSSDSNTLSKNSCNLNSYDGIGLFSSSNYNILSNNSCSSNSESGIYLVSSGDNTLNGNSMTGDGILFDGSAISQWDTQTIDTSNTANEKPIYYYKDQTGVKVPSGVGQVILANCTDFVIENQTLNNVSCGIQLGFSSGALIENNSCSDNVCGIYLNSSVSNALTSNIMNGGGIAIGGTTISQWNTQTIGTSNTANGRPIYYYKDQTGVKVPSGVGQVILANCTDFVIENQTLNNVSCGIQLGFSSGALIENNTCSNDYLDGMFLSSSNGNRLLNNNCSNNGDGVDIYSSDSNTLMNNSVSNNGYGIYLESSNSSAVLGNLISNNTGYGVFIDTGSSLNSIWNNTFIGNNGATDKYDALAVQAYDNGTSNSWNSPEGYGNYWSDWMTSTGPYAIDGGAGAKDYHPLGVASGTSANSVLISAVIVVAVVLVGLVVIWLLVAMFEKKKKSKGDGIQKGPL